MRLENYEIQILIDILTEKRKHDDSGLHQDTLDFIIAELEDVLDDRLAG